MKINPPLKTHIPRQHNAVLAGLENGIEHNVGIGAWERAGEVRYK